MAHLELTTTVPLYNTFIHNSSESNNTKYAHPLDTSHQHYPTEDDRNTLATSPTSSWDSSRRSSYSSISSTSYHTHFSSSQSLRIKHCKSLPASTSSNNNSNNNTSHLYPTKEAAHKRIEWLEEQLCLSRQSNEAIVKRMSQSIQAFLDGRKKNNDLELPSFQDTSISGGNASHRTSSTDNEKAIKQDQDQGNSSQHHAMKLVLDKLEDLKNIVNKYNISLTLDQVSDDHYDIKNDTQQQQQQQQQKQVYFSTQMIDKWIDGVTQHKQLSTKQDLKNVVIPLLVGTEKERERNAQLTNALNRLSSQKKAAHHDAIQQTKARIASLQAAFEKQKKQLRQHLQRKLEESKEEQNEMEQVVDDMRQEMETMLEELSQSKQQRERFEQKANRLQDDLKALLALQQQQQQQQQQSSSDNAVEDIDFLALQSLLRESETQIDQLQADNQELNEKFERVKQEYIKEKSRIHATHKHQVNALVLEKEELRARLVKAEKSVAMFTEKTANDSELEKALRRTVAERDGELAKAKVELEKSQRQHEQLQKLSERQMQLELSIRLVELEKSLKLQAKKDMDTYQVQLTRDLRNLSGQMVELETEMQDLERQHLQDVKSMEQSQQKLATLQKEWLLKSAQWQKEQDKLKTALLGAEQKIATLEKEALILYGKNLDLARHLGELDA